jgi:hypothetical protein
MATATKYHPIQNSIKFAEDLGLKVYEKVTPARVDKYLRETSLVKKGTKTVVALKETIDPVLDVIDVYGSSVMEWVEEKYRAVFYNNLMKMISAVKDFYSSENSDYARICLRFLTLAIPDPTYMETAYPEKFYEGFKYDPQFGKESFQKILQHFYQHAKEHWHINKNSKPNEIVRNALYVVASTMEDISIPSDQRVHDYAQRMADHFVESEPTVNLFSRKHFRTFYKQLLKVDELNADQISLADQYLQIASVLFDLANMSNKDLIDWTIHSFNYIRIKVEDLTECLHTKASATINYVSRAIPTQYIKGACSQVVLRSKEFYKIGKDGVVTIWHKSIDSYPIQYCLKLAHQLDLALRHNGETLIAMFKKNEKAFLTYIKEHREEIREYLDTKAKTVSAFSSKTKEDLKRFLSKQEIKASELAGVGKDVADLLYQVSAEYSLYYKEKLSAFITRNYELVKDETKSLGKLVFEKLRIHEIASFVLVTLRKVEEYLRIKESLSKLDLITNQCAVEVEKRHLLTKTSSEGDEQD